MTPRSDVADAFVNGICINEAILLVRPVWTVLCFYGPPTQTISLTELTDETRMLLSCIRHWHWDLRHHHKTINGPSSTANAASRTLPTQHETMRLFAASVTFNAFFTDYITVIYIFTSCDTTQVSFIGHSGNRTLLHHLHRVVNCRLISWAVP